MHPSDRSSHGRRRPPGFPSAFPDPFAGFGMLGGSPFFDDFFSSNPFDDPFFTRPFGSMFSPFGSPFGPPRGSMGLLEPDAFFGRSNGGFLEERPFHPPPAEGRRGPVIEELPDDHETPENNSRHDQQPIVEHPDDDVGSAGTTRPATIQLRQGQSFQTQPNRDYLSNRGYQSNSGHQSYSYQSTSVTYGGTGGTYYSSSSMRRLGPDGLMEEEHMEKDSSGKETKMAARGLRHKVHAVTKKRTANGPESTVETLHNLTPEEAPHFDAQWEAHAQRSLPGRNRGTQMLDGIGTRPTQQQQALTYNEGYHDGSQPRKKQIKS